MKRIMIVSMTIVTPLTLLVNGCSSSEETAQIEEALEQGIDELGEEEATEEAAPEKVVAPSGTYNTSGMRVWFVKEATSLRPEPSRGASELTSLSPGDQILAKEANGWLEIPGRGFVEKEATSTTPVARKRMPAKWSH